MITLLERLLISVRFLLGGAYACVLAAAHIFALTQTEAEESLSLISFFINAFHQTTASSDMLSQWVQSSNSYIFHFCALMAAICKVYK